MYTYFAIFIVSTTASLLLTPAVRAVARRRGWLDVPRDARRVHRIAVPRIGGVAVALSVMLGLAALLFVDNRVSEKVGEQIGELAAVFVPAALILAFGVYDDLRGAAAKQKFFVQAVAAALFYLMGGRVEALSIPFVGTVELHWTLGFALTIFWVVAVTNAFNLIDGMDGLAAGAALFASLVTLSVALSLDRFLVAVVGLALCGALAGFLRYNFNPASIFLGDCGSLFVGFVLSALSVQGTQKAATSVAVAIPVLSLGLPVLDTTLAILRRFLSGRGLFQADREHIHHMLLARGWSQRRVALVLYGVCALFGLSALVFVSNTGRATGLVLFVVGAAVTVGIGRLRYHEFDELRDTLKRRLALPDRRMRTANHICVRRATRSLSEAATLAELFDALLELLQMSEFTFVSVELGDARKPLQTAAAFERECAGAPLRGARLCGGRIFWQWERGDIEAAEVLGSNDFWKLSLPLKQTGGAALGMVEFYRECGGGSLLLDINYLCSLFQREMARAAERILADAVERHEPEHLRAAS